MPDEEAPRQDLNSLYVSDKLLATQIMGVDFEFRELTGEEYTQIIDECVSSDGRTLNRGKYCRMLFGRTVVSPKDIDFDRLNAAAYATIVAELEKLQGLTEVALKNLGER